MVAFDTSGVTKVTSGVTTATVDITAAAAGAQVYCLVALASGLNTSITFTGWTLVNSLTGAEGTATFYGLFRRQKIAGDTTFTVTWASTATHAIIPWVSYTGLDAATPDEGAAVLLHTVAGTGFASPSVTPSAASRWALFFAWARDTTLAADLPDGTTWTPDAALAERSDASTQAAGSAPWIAAEAADSNGAVTQAAHSYTATCATSESHGGAFLLYLIPAAAAAPATARPLPAPSRSRAPSRAALGARGLCAAGILAAGITAQPGVTVPPPQPRPVITHPAPHRAVWRSVTGQAYAAVPAPRQGPPRPRAAPPHRALWQRITAAPRQSWGPSRLPLPLRRPGPHRAISGGVRGPQPAAVTGVAVPPPGWHPQPRFTPAHRAAWRAVAGLPAPPQTVTTPPPRQLPQVPRRAPARGLWRARAVPPRTGTLPVPHPAAIPRQAPHRVIWRLVTGQPPAAGIAVRPPKLIPQPRHLPSARAAWRRVTGTGNAPPPAFSIGALTASDVPAAVLTAAGAASALTASTAPQGTLTAGTQSTGGPS